MLNYDIFPTSLIFVQTRKGRSEIVRPTFGLSSRERRILNAMDGTRCISDLACLCPMPELDEIVATLLERGYIVQSHQEAMVQTVPEIRSAGPRETAARATSAVPISASRARLRADPEAYDAARLAQAKILMSEVCAIHLGMLGSEIVAKIERASDTPSLLSLIGEWHMALCESKYGSHYAGMFIDQLKQLLLHKCSCAHRTSVDHTQSCSQSCIELRMG